MSTRPIRRPRTLARALMVAGLALPAWLPSHAGTTEVSQTPLGLATNPKPNVMFVLDNSGSMRWRYMPDDLAPNPGSTEWPDVITYGLYSAHCNGVAYDPDVSYVPPVNPDGTSYANASFTAAWNDGYNQSAGTTNLNNQTYYLYTGSQARMAWTYGSNGQVVQNTFYNECMTRTTASSAVFTAVTLTTASDATVLQNYANWYAYYRTRRLTMRTAAGRAMQQVDGSFRVGFTAISDSSVTGSSFLNVDDFATGSTQRSRFFELLYSTTGEGRTPLRSSLAKVGRYYAKRISGQTYDPVGYSCQRNYALLSTDGYWNEDINNVPKLDGSSQIGNEDSDATQFPRPTLDSTGATGSLADVAAYYWKTDLRSDFANEVEASDNDSATWQHLNLFTLGLGVKGTLALSDLAALQAGTKAWPVPSGTLNANNDDATHIDDLWHAALNGRGSYFSVTNPTTLSAAITTTFREIASATATGSAAATSSQTPVSGDDWVFVSSYRTYVWSGDLKAWRYTFDNGKVVTPDTTSTATRVWSAAAKLDARTTDRRILFNANGSTTSGLDSFTYAKLSAAGLATPFDSRCATTGTVLSQCSSGALSASQRDLVTGDALVRYLAGERSLESTLLRLRTSRLGDAVNAAPVYAGAPPFGYSDAGYSAYATSKASRTKVVYMASNDGMLHAFKVAADADGGGTELWAFVPTAVLPEMWRLADVNYGASHRYYLDATPVVADVYDGTQWRTILVGGMGAGGRSYYALDVTDPENPALLWEFGYSSAVTSGSLSKFFYNENLGQTYGTPIVTKNAAGRWVVALPSGMNNVSPGDGVARLFVRDAITGADMGVGGTGIDGLATSAGDTTTPANLLRVNGWVASDTDNTTLRFYGGDMLGNLWRFDTDDLVAPTGREARLIGLARAADATTVQPITTKPVLSEMRYGAGKVAIIAFGTGRYLHENDLSDNTLQTIYAVKDSLTDLGTGGLGVLRSSGANLVEQVLGSDRKVASPASVNWTTQNGWFVDLDRSSGERVIIDGTSLSSGLLAFVSTLPSTAMCSSGGQSYLYLFLLASGTVHEVYSYDALAVGLTRMGNPDGTISAQLTFKTGLRNQTVDNPPASPDLVAKRTSWRELTD